MADEGAGEAAVGAGGAGGGGGAGAPLEDEEEDLYSSTVTPLTSKASNASGKGTMVTGMNTYFGVPGDTSGVVFFDIRLHCVQDGYI